MADDGELTTQSQAERDVLNLFRTVLAESTKTGRFFLGTVVTPYGRVNISLSNETANIPKREAQMPNEASPTLSDILNSLNHLNDTREKADSMERENQKRIRAIIDNLLPDHPYKEDLKNILVPSP